MLKIIPIVCFYNVSTHFFILNLRANEFYNFYLGIVDPFIFIH